LAPHEKKQGGYKATLPIVPLLHWLALFESLAFQEWGEFFIDDVAQILSGRDIYESERYAGNTPYISSTAKNNGIGHFVANNNNTLEAGCLSVNRNGSVGYSFYHPYQGLFSNDCRKLRPFIKSKYVGIFLSNQITNQREKYNYGYKMGTARLKRQKIMLPVDNDGKLDWQFMEQYTKCLMDKKTAEHLECCRKELAKLKFKTIEALEDKEWKEFFIGGKDGFFNISSTSSGIDKNKLNITSENTDEYIPYITRTDIQNGINMFIPNQQDSKYKTDEGGLITIGLDTQTVFYQPFKFFTGQNIQVLRHENLNRWTASFLIPLLKVQMTKFNWGGNGATLGRLFRTKIMLPVTRDGMPDYEYMTQHMINLEYKKRKEFIDFSVNEKLSKPKANKKIQRTLKSAPLI